MKKRSRVGIILDFSIRIPQFKETFLKLKEQVLVGIAASQHLDQADIIDENNYWTKTAKEDPKVIEFYSQVTLPDENSKDFDITFRKYFMTNEHRLQFLTEWSYNLFGQGSVTNKADITLINTAQAKLCDIILIDRCTNARKIPNTFAFLSRSGLFIKEVIFTNTEDEMDEIKKNLIACWDPFKDPNQIIVSGSKPGIPTEGLMNFFIETEKLINK